MYNVFNKYNLLINCNNHLCKHFKFTNFIYFVTLAYIRKRLPRGDVNKWKRVGVMYEIDIAVNIVFIC
jgi:hypothetical protein